MRILVLGAGAIGGYFGSRLLAAGRDVTFLVRPQRQAALRESGLRVRSAFGDLDLPRVPAITASDVASPYDVVLLACKAYDLEGAMEGVAPAVGRSTMVIPLLNGLRHLRSLQARFGDRPVLGGHGLISTTVDPDGSIRHLNDLHLLGFGELAGGSSPRTEELATAIAGAGFESHRSDEILQEMWEKWVFIATTAGITCLLRGAIGDILESGAEDLPLRLLEETSAIAGREGHAPRPPATARYRQILLQRGSAMTASMLRDLEEGGRIEADHVLGDLLAREPDPDPRSLLRLAYVHLKTYEARRAREGSG